MMRRAAAILLIAVSGWLLFSTAGMAGLIDHPQAMGEAIGQPQVLMPALGGIFGLIGGAIVLLGGPGGALIGLIGGALAAGYGLYAGDSFGFAGFRAWENGAIVGLAILALSGAAALMGRD
jgi:hypothetical protein